MAPGGNGHDKNNPWGKGKDDANVIDFRKRREEEARKQKEREKAERLHAIPSAEPMINLPDVTKYLLGLLLLIHLVVTYALDNTWHNWAFIHLGFIPGRFTGAALFEPLQFITPLTHMFLHGSWLHMGMNGVMLLAFGSGLERWIGGKKMLVVFFLSGLFGIAAHFVLDPNSIHPVVGASGGLSGMFAVALIMLNRQNSGMSGRYGIMPFVILWIGISVLFGLMGSPDGASIAWAAHIGGFLGGFAVAKLLKL
jgi:membrane associated rhomboid family serine protease